MKHKLTVVFEVGSVAAAMDLQSALLQFSKFSRQGSTDSEKHRELAKALANAISIAEGIITNTAIDKQRG